METGMEYDLIGGEVPMGFGMALAQNNRAMERFALLTDSEKQRVLSHIHGINSKQEMRAYVQRLGEDKLTF